MNSTPVPALAHPRSVRTTIHPPRVVEGAFWTRPRYGTAVHAYACHSFGEYSVYTGRRTGRDKLTGPHFVALCRFWHEAVPAAWDDDDQAVVPVAPLRHDRPLCPACLDLLDTLQATRDELRHLPDPRKLPRRA